MFAKLRSGIVINLNSVFKIERVGSQVWFFKDSHSAHIEEYDTEQHAQKIMEKLEEIR